MKESFVKLTSLEQSKIFIVSSGQRLKQKRHSNLIGKMTILMYENNQSVSDVKNYKLGVSLKGALVIGLGIEVGVIVDSTGSFGLYGTGYWGTGVQIGVGNSDAKGIKGLFDLLFGGGIGAAPGDIASAQGLGHSADGGALVLGTWDLNAPNKSGAPNSLSGIGVGGGVWWSATGV